MVWGKSKLLITQFAYVLIAACCAILQKLLLVSSCSILLRFSITASCSSISFQNSCFRCSASSLKNETLLLVYKSALMMQCNYQYLFYGSIRWLSGIWPWRLVKRHLWHWSWIFLVCCCTTGGSCFGWIEVIYDNAENRKTSIC